MLLTSSRLVALAAFLAAFPASADIDSGAYLAGRTATLNNDFLPATRYFTQSLRSDPTNPALLQNAMAAHGAVGNLETAAALAEVLRDLGEDAQLSNLVLLSHLAQTGDWAQVSQILESGDTVSPLVDEIALSWSYVGQGDMARANAAFEAARQTEGLGDIARYHHVIALALVGDHAGADAVVAAPGQRYTSRSAFAHAQILSQLDRNEDAMAMLDAVFGDVSDAALSELKAQLSSGAKLPFDLINDAEDGLAELFHFVAQFVRDDAPPSFALLYSRMAEALNPELTQAILMSGSLLEEMQQYELASDTYTRIAKDDPAFSAAELGRIDVLRRAGDTDAAIEAAQGLVASHGQLAGTHDRLGDVLRAGERREEAIDAYTNALALLPENSASRWLVLYKRAVTYHLTDQWPLAEEGFRAALALNPNQPLVLNYLGYSLVERGEKMDEALGMIETAVAGAPQNGAIVDSLGWVLFQLGRYKESVGHMEKAASLEAVDPIVNDHLGDVYWAVGRDIEATFQWNRALSFDPEPELADRIRRKLEVGLDVVLEEEGADPLQAVDGN